MAKVVAITSIQHGLPDGEVHRYEIGDDLGGLDEDTQKSLVLGGSAVEIGKGRKFTPEAVAGAVDEATAKRDALIQQSLAGDEPASAESAKK